MLQSMNCHYGLEGLESRQHLAISGLPISLGSAGFDMGKRVAVTPDGGFVIAGLFGGTVDFDPGAGRTLLHASGDTDIFVAKYSSAGSLEWVRQFGGSEAREEITDQDVIDVAARPYRAGGAFVNGVGADPRGAGEYVNDLAVAPDGSVFLVGSFRGRVDFNPGQGRKIFTTYDNDYHDAFVVKLNGSGQYVWAARFGGRFTDAANALALDSAGNIYVTGLFSRTVSFVDGNRDFTLTANGRADGFLMKLDSAGAVQWVRSFGGKAVSRAEREAGNDVAVDSVGRVYVVGAFAGEVDFDSGAGISLVRSAGRTDGFLARFDSNGVFQAVKSFSGRGYDGLTSLAIDSQDNLIVAGYFEGDQFDADPGQTTFTLQATAVRAGGARRFTDGFIEKLDANLELRWIRQLAGTGVEFVEQVRVDSADNVLVSGSFYGTAKFGRTGPTLSSILGTGDFDDANDLDREYSYDAYLWKLNASGRTTWVRTFGGRGDDFGAGIGVAPDGPIVQTGRQRRTTLKFGLANAFVMGWQATGEPLS